MQHQFWEKVAWSWFAVQTWCVVIILDILLTGGLYLHLFLTIFAGVYFLNRRLFWPKI